MTLPTTTELLLSWDGLRPRSQQTAMGMSSLGGCRRQAGYHLGGYPQDEDYEPSGMAMVLGTSIHETAAEAARMFLRGALAEKIEVWFGGLPGHPDLYLDGVVRDIKTLGFAMQLEQRRQSGPTQGERFQIHAYGAGLILAGYEVHTVELDYVDRSTGDEYLHSEPFSVDVVQEAMAWLDQVRSADVSMLPRDYRPESGHCQSCPWFRECWQAEPGKDPRSVLYVEDPDAAAWAARLEDARKRKKQAEEDEKDAKGALDALRTVSRAGEREYIKVPGLDRELRFRMDKGKSSPDMPRIAIDYKNAGARPPMRQGAPIVNIALVKPRDDDGD